jgi:hypothetical protein
VHRAVFFFQYLIMLGFWGEAVAATDPAWAVNVGGGAYTGVDGTVYEAESSVQGGNVGEIAAAGSTQDAYLYQSYLRPYVSLRRTEGNGSRRAAVRHPCGG